MTFGYDVQQNRFKKEVKTSDKQKINYYFRDAQGNVLSIYRKSATFGQKYFFCEEQTLYGSARLGTEQVEHSMRGLVTNDGLTDEITRAREQHGDDWQQRLDEQYDGRFYERLQEAWGNEWSTRLDLVLQGNTHEWLIEQIRNESYTLQAGNKRYELSNHLGNVLAVVSDKKEQSDGVTWSAIVVSAQDYYPFGMAMPGRSTNAKHRYGFNGKETDPETGIQDYGMRWYLPNIARFPRVDPITAKYPMLTPYQFASNTPIVAIDLDGLESAPPKIEDGVTVLKTLQVGYEVKNPNPTSNKDKYLYKNFTNKPYSLFKTSIGMTTVNDKVKEVKDIAFLADLDVDAPTLVTFNGMKHENRPKGFQVSITNDNLFVIPSPTDRGFGNSPLGDAFQEEEVDLGDLAMVNYNGKISIGIIVDYGPPTMLGEMNQKGSGRLGLGISTRSGGTPVGNVKYHFFSNSAHYWHKYIGEKDDKTGKPLTNQQMYERGYNDMVKDRQEMIDKMNNTLEQQPVYNPYDDSDGQ